MNNIEQSEIEFKGTKERPFDKWQKEQCEACQVSQTVYICAQIKYNFYDYQMGELSLEKGCPEREEP